MKNEIVKGNFGIEKETLRVSKDGHVVSTPHPINDINSKFDNPYITVDFSEQQVEVITGINSSIENAVEELKLLTNIVYRSMNKDEYLWNYSMPFGSTKKSSISLGDCKATKYRKKLLLKSTYDMQLISGIHFNFSFANEFSSSKTDLEINALYFKICKKYAKLSFVIQQMFGASPTKDFIKMDKISHRQSSDGGYHNHNSDLKCFCNFNSYKSYKDFINDKIAKKEIDSFREVYTNIRLKPFNGKRVEWIEVRNIDLDYTQPYAVDINKLNFTHKFLMFLAFSNTDIENQVSSNNEDEFNFTNTLVVLKEVKKWMVKEGLDISFVSSYINKMSKGKYDAQVVPDVKKIIDQQVKLKKDIAGIPLKPIDDMELSTQILIEESYKDGLNIKIVDRDKNKVKLNNSIIEMATLNPFDSKKGLMIIDSKIETNTFLSKNNFKTTEQNIYKSIKLASKDFEKFKNKKIVIKPVKANFSKGLSVFEKGFDKDDYLKAIEFAFSFDETILIEKFVAGPEYRFLVIDSKVIGVLKRVPANVKGDGKHTIKELTLIKNKNILRGENYKLPLEKIKLGKIEIDYLKKQNLNINSIPKLNEVVYLRKNSNISTGGDSIDVTDIAHETYKQIAIQATDKLNLKVCGLDMIIPNVSENGDYTILEMNWNPATHMHAYPLVGINRSPAKEMIKLVKKYG